ncbi:MAG: TMEM175 family protein [Sediminibacterium sp.]
MSEIKETSIHREFELERMVLFSDAVFAIAITLLIIEIKFPELPEDYKTSPYLWKMFAPTLLHFLGFFISFFVIGMSWAGHLKMFRYLKTYDNGVIFRNLASLFFIVAFPFAASGLTHFTSGFFFPMIIYLGNILLINLTNFLLAHYIFKSKPFLSIPGHQEEKKFIYLQTKATALVLGICYAIILTTAILSNFDSETVSYSTYSLVLGMPAMKFWLKKYKPKKESASVS